MDPCLASSERRLGYQGEIILTLKFIFTIPSALQSYYGSLLYFAFKRFEDQLGYRESDYRIVTLARTREFRLLETYILVHLGLFVRFSHPTFLPLPISRSYELPHSTMTTTLADSDNPQEGIAECRVPVVTAFAVCSQRLWAGFFYSGRPSLCSLG